MDLTRVNTWFCWAVTGLLLTLMLAMTASAETIPLAAHIAGDDLIWEGAEVPNGDAHGYESLVVFDPTFQRASVSFNSPEGSELLNVERFDAGNPDTLFFVSDDGLADLRLGLSDDPSLLAVDSFFDIVTDIQLIWFPPDPLNAEMPVANLNTGKDAPHPVHPWVPEPSSAVLLMLGIAGIGARLRKR